MTKKGLFVTAVIGVFYLLSGCSQPPVTAPMSTPTIAPPQNPYQSKTSTPIIPTATVSLPDEQPILPTSTPFIHVVKPGDTLFGIALNYNISLDKLVSANPGVDTSILSIGMEINIPFTADEDLTIPTPTPYLVPFSDPVCYLSNAGGVWCFSVVKNNHAVVLENISAAFNMYDQKRELIQSVIAIPPLNYFFPDQSMPLAAYFETDFPGPFQVSADLITSLPSERTEPLTVISDPVYRYRENNSIADINGLIKLEESEFSGNQIWIAAVGFHEGSPVGIRKWISSQEIKVNEEIPFELVLYSLGPSIDQIQLISEIH